MYIVKLAMKLAQLLQIQIAYQKNKSIWDQVKLTYIKICMIYTIFYSYYSVSVNTSANHLYLGLVAQSNGRMVR